MPISRDEEKDFILNGFWPIDDILFMKRGQQTGFIRRYELTAVYDHETMKEVARYKTVEEMMEDGWLVD